MQKPAKPYPEFPLFAHARGKWAKKINGKLHYFGRWEDPVGAFNEYTRLFGNDIQVPVRRDFLNLYEALNEFLIAKEDALLAESLSKESFRDYKSTCRAFVKFFGESKPVNSFEPEDFIRYKRDRSKKLNIISMGNEIQRIRTAFKWLKQSKLIREEPEYGPDFKKASKLQLRRHKRSVGSKCYQPKQIHDILAECSPHIRAMVMLGINCGYGPTDIALLELDTFQLACDTGFIEYARRKTEIARCAWMWPETRQAIDETISVRPEPNKDSEHLLFIYRDGGSWNRSANPISKRFGEARKWSGQKKGDFYWLRHTFETISGCVKDQVATDLVMGHVDASMGDNYRHHIDEHRIQTVCQSVREWLFASPKS